MKEMTRHHRKPQSVKLNDDPTNISIVPVTQHRAWHTLFENYNPDKIKSLINKVWLDPDYKFFVVRKRKLAKIPKSKLKWTIH